MEIIRQIASTEGAGKSSLIEMLGIDWKMLIFQIIAFLVMVLLLSKFVYPWLMKSVDERQSKIDATAKAMIEAQAATQNSEKRIAKLMAEAQVEANDIVNTAKSESAAALTVSENKSKKRAEQIIADAGTQIENEILAAKKALHNETIELVALATEKIVGKAVSKDIDNSLIADAVKDVKK